jgi:hypothetical protein
VHSDSRPEAEQVQIELARRATPAEKMAQVRMLSDLAARLSRRAIARAHPELSEAEVELEWVALQYGKPLADALRAYREGR